MRISDGSWAEVARASSELVMTASPMASTSPNRSAARIKNAGM
jgi:hypothetical protein